MNAGDHGGGVGEQLLVVVPDANVLIHGKALVDLPWAELGRSQIEVLFVPPVVRELDKLKTQSGRQNKIARQLSSDIRALITSPDRRAEVRKANPAVDKRIELGAVTTPLHPALRLDHADQALINYLLWLRQKGRDVLLLTDDTICGTTAQEVGLSVLFLPETWLRPPEPDESAKENAKLRAEVRRLSAAEPKVELGFHSAEGGVLTELTQKLTRWPALTEAELDELMAEVQEHCPQATSFERLKPRGADAIVGRIERASRLSSFQLRSVYEPATEEEIEAYKTEHYPNWLESVRLSLATLHHTLEAQTEWPVIVATSANAGTRPAVEALLTIQARGDIALLNYDDVDEAVDDDEQAEVRAADFHLQLPPTPPRGRTKTIDPLRRYRGLDARSFAAVRQTPFHLPQISSPKPRDSDAFYWRIGRHDWSGTIELECASWRHGQDPLEFILKVRPEKPVVTSAVIEITVHAHNITDPPVSRLPVRFDYEEGMTLEKGRSLVNRLIRMAVL